MRYRQGRQSGHGRPHTRLQVNRKAPQIKYASIKKLCRLQEEGQSLPSSGLPPSQLQLSTGRENPQQNQPSSGPQGPLFRSASCLHPRVRKNGAYTQWRTFHPLCLAAPEEFSDKGSICIQQYRWIIKFNCFLKQIQCWEFTTTRSTEFHHAMLLVWGLS